MANTPPPVDGGVFRPFFAKMAIVTTPIADPLPGIPTPRRSITSTRLVKQDIVRQGHGGWSKTIRRRTSRHDARSPKQIACRAPMHFAALAYHDMNTAEKGQWNDVHPEDFFCEAVKRWLQQHSPAVSPYYPLNDQSAITISATATASIASMLLRFTPITAYALWGVAILRDRYPIITPTWPMLRIIYPTTTDHEQTWIDHPLSPGLWHYRLAACEITGRLGPFSPDVFDTVT